jgi:hypothetical protein
LPTESAPAASAGAAKAAIKSNDATAPTSRAQRNDTNAPSPEMTGAG